jgi:L-alanine-DL-glutamate epimerase-like enolase superfamily enzyme
VAHTLENYVIRTLRLKYPRKIRWAGSQEEGMDIVLLTLRSTEGAQGIAETPVRLKWHSASVRSFKATLEDVFMPVMMGVDLLDVNKTKAALSYVREHPLAKSLIDSACWDLRAAVAGVPLWKLLGADSDAVPVSFTVTRAAPEAMAADAVRAVETAGVKAFKIKTGQDFEVDKAAVKAIRDAVGPGVELFVDSNGANTREEVRPMSEMLAEFNVLYFEDPCLLMPTRQFADIARDCVMPILVDNGCRSVRDATLFIDAGAQALSVKTMKTGITESLAIADKAKKTGCKVSVGISASSSLGAISALALANALPAETRRIPCEETFFLTAGGFLNEDLKLVNGCVQLPSSSGLREAIDWKKVESITVP